MASFPASLLIHLSCSLCHWTPVIYLIKHCPITFTEIKHGWPASASHLKSDMKSCTLVGSDTGVYEKMILGFVFFVQRDNQSVLELLWTLSVLPTTTSAPLALLWLSPASSLNWSAWATIPVTVYLRYTVSESIGLKSAVMLEFADIGFPINALSDWVSYVAFQMPSSLWNNDRETLSVLCRVLLTLSNIVSELAIHDCPDGWN